MASLLSVGAKMFWSWFLTQPGFDSLETEFLRKDLTFIIFYPLRVLNSFFQQNYIIEVGWITLKILFTIHAHSKKSNFSPGCVDCANLLLGCSIKRHIILFFFCMGVEMNFVVWNIRISRNLTRQILLNPNIWMFWLDSYIPGYPLKVLSPGHHYLWSIG